MDHDFHFLRDTPGDVYPTGQFISQNESLYGYSVAAAAATEGGVIAVRRTDFPTASPDKALGLSIFLVHSQRTTSAKRYASLRLTHDVAWRDESGARG